MFYRIIFSAGLLLTSTAAVDAAFTIFSVQAVGQLTLQTNENLTLEGGSGLTLQ